MSQSFDDVRDEIEARHSLGDEEFQTALIELAEVLEPHSPGRAEIFHALGERRMMRDDPAGALAWLERAVAEDGPVTIDPRAGVLQALLELGREEEAEALLTTLRRASAARDHRGVFHEAVGETLEMAYRLREAHRWFNLGLRDLDPDDPTVDEVSCLYGRFRTRRALELPLDQLDLLTEDVREVERLRTSLGM